MGTIIRRAAGLFVALLALGACLYALVWWHHSGVAAACSPSTVPEDATCASRLWFFGFSWPGLLGLLFGGCVLVVWRWSRGRRQRGD